jgi:hypothetical protein
VSRFPKRPSPKPFGSPGKRSKITLASMSPRRAADLLGIKQPDVSKMLRGEFRQFSVELLRFLVALDQDVEIVVKPHRDAKNAPALHVS